MEGRRYKNYKLTKPKLSKRNILPNWKNLCIMNFKRPMSRYIIQFQNTRDMRRFQLLLERKKQIYKEWKSEEHQILTATLYIRGQWGNTFKILWKNNLNLIVHSQSNCQKWGSVFWHAKSQNSFLPPRVEENIKSRTQGAESSKNVTGSLSNFKT